jgi:hypothetical protein
MQRRAEQVLSCVSLRVLNAPRVRNTGSHLHNSCSRGQQRTESALFVIKAVRARGG